MRPRKAAALAAFWTIQILSLVSKVFSSGGGAVFELKLDSFRNEHGLNANENCCNGIRTAGTCSSKCKTFFRICLAHYMAVIDPNNLKCTFANLTTSVLGDNNIQFDQDLPGTFHNPVKFPIQFSWPGTFSLIIEAWHDTTLPNLGEIPSPASPKELISRLAVQRSAEVGPEWSKFVYNDRFTELHYNYRVLCDQHYYGPRCTELCKPRDDQFGHYVCHENGTKICLDGWTGNYCDQAICLPGCEGFCDEPNECKCKVGWEGKFCNQCIPYPGCLHGSCTKPWQCKCKEGWGGLFCNQDLNFCTHHSPCKNNATCSNTGQGSYTCHCSHGYTGTNCEVEIDDCERQPCKNGGSCQDLGRSFKCRCPEGFYGRQCENAADSCKKNPCANGATCHEQQGSYTCSCAPGFTGLNCESEINECDPNPCKNGGRCIDQLNGFRCNCASGFSGSTCEENLDDCTHNPCLNGGTCVDKVNDFECRCVPGFVGSLCHTNVDDCEMRPCANGGSCQDLVNDFACSCAPGFAGKDCRININECESQPCQNGGKCIDHIADYSCQCKEGFKGKNCHLREGMTEKNNHTSTSSVHSTTTETTTKTTTMEQTTTQHLMHVSNNVSKQGQSPGAASAENGSLSMSQLLIIVCLGAGIPLVLIIVIVTVLLCRKKRHLMQDNMRKEKEQNIVNNMNNKCVDSNIFTTIPPSSSSIKISNEQDFKNVNAKQSVLDRTSGKNSNIKDLNTHEQPYLQKRDFEKPPCKRLDVESLPVDTNSDISDYSRCPRDIQVIVKPINKERNQNSLSVLEQQQSLWHNPYEDVLATEV